MMGSAAAGFFLNSSRFVTMALSPNYAIPLALLLEAYTARPGQGERRVGSGIIWEQVETGGLCSDDFVSFPGFDWQDTQRRFVRSKR
mmetsp:Transcript_40468/g.63173  ORF Transcript_40468/g.63173 Transcript_40468/m.63173 type:complete len:87 (-) Transcript_40468:392-652(-)